MVIPTLQSPPQTQQQQQHIISALKSPLAPPQMGSNPYGSAFSNSFNKTSSGGGGGNTGNMNLNNLFGQNTGPTPSSSNGPTTSSPTDSMTQPQSTSMGQGLFGPVPGGPDAGAVDPSAVSSLGPLDFMMDPSAGAGLGAGAGMGAEEAGAGMGMADLGGGMGAGLAALFA